MDIRYPLINGRTDAERLLQIQRYLYSLVDAINLESKKGNKSTENEQVTKMGAEADKIIGMTMTKSDDVEWIVRVWSSGYKECFGKLTQSATLTSGSNSIWVTPKELPIQYEDTPICFVSGGIESGAGTSHITQSGVATTTETPFIFVNIDASSNDTTNAIVCYHIYGK